MRSTILFITFFVLYSCGASKLATDANKNTITSSSYETSGCLCTSDYMPVCGADNKTYENTCMAQCFGNKTFNPGQCVCSSTAPVCGSDGVDYNECEALNKKIKIAKYAPCASTAL